MTKDELKAKIVEGAVRLAQAAGRARLDFAALDDELSADTIRVAMGRVTSVVESSLAALDAVKGDYDELNALLPPVEKEFGAQAKESLLHILNSVQDLHSRVSLLGRASREADRLEDEVANGSAPAGSQASLDTMLSKNQRVVRELGGFREKNVSPDEILNTAVRDLHASL
ncbi:MULTISPECIES: hypothetical protein [Stenotrophomonas]|uniref:hypothetical protein n=1 Tax=Stenotrophomonas TaxID=40323 RepID=UPI0018D30896|nr:hypothetical protein [Stenotrophomonas sp.]MBH1508376.1 hypothetical protein [Stenotrophomonas maltophilia]